MYQVSEMILRLAGQGGFTYDVDTGLFVEIGSRRGYVIAFEGTEHHVGDYDTPYSKVASSIRSAIFNIDQLLDLSYLLGGWYSIERDVFMVEAVEIRNVPKAQAVALAKARNQEGILSIRTGAYVPVGGTGDKQKGA